MLKDKLLEHAKVHKVLSLKCLIHVHPHYYPCSRYQAQIFRASIFPLCYVHKKFWLGDEANMLPTVHIILQLPGTDVDTGDEVNTRSWICIS